MNFLKEMGQKIAFGSWYDRFAALAVVCLPVDLVFSWSDFREWGIFPGLMLIVARDVLFAAVGALFWKLF